MTTKLQYMDEHCFIEQESNRIAKLEHLADRRNMRGGAQRGQSPFLWCRCFLHEKTKKSEISFSAERASGAAIKVDTEAAAAVSARHCASSGEAT